MGARVLMVALDGADSRLLDEWSRDGTLTALTALRARGRADRLTAPDGITDDGLWASFQYATGPGEHGRYFREQKLAGGKTGLPLTDEAELPRFWDRLSAEGYRVAVLDIPRCAPPRPINGIHLTDWGVHGRYSRYPLSFPPELAGEVLKRFGPAPPSRCSADQGPLGDGEVRDMLEHLETGIMQKRAAALHYLGRETWDAFVVGFKEAHCAGHALWDLADPRHPEHDAARNAALVQPMRQVMRHLDAAIAELINAAGPGADVVVFSTTEMMPNGSAAHLMPEVVQRLNVLLGNRGWRRRLRRMLRQPPPLELLPYSENGAALRVHGGASVVERAVGLLGELVVQATGERLFDQIDQPSRTESGPRAARLPDILLHFRPGVLAEAIDSVRLGRFAMAPPALRPGNHAPGLFAISAGAGVTKVGGPRSLEDFGPLIGWLLAAGKPRAASAP